MSFKKGDIIICRDADATSGQLTINKHYQVLNVYGSSSEFEHRYTVVINDEGLEESYWTSRFRFVETPGDNILTKVDMDVYRKAAEKLSCESLLQLVSMFQSIVSLKRPKETSVERAIEI